MRTPAYEAQTVTPVADMEALLDLSRFLEQVTEPAALLGPDGQTVPLPLETYQLLRQVVTLMEQGKAITIAPIDQKLTTQEAADFLGISRPTFVKLLEDGTLPFEHTAGGRHRRVLLCHVVQYQEKIRAERRAALDQLTADAYAAGLYDDTPETYQQALRDARAKLQQK